MVENVSNLKAMKGHLDLTRCVDATMKFTKEDAEQTSWLVSKFCEAI